MATCTLTTGLMEPKLPKFSEIAEYVTPAIKAKKDRENFKKLYKAVRKLEYMKHYEKQFEED
jgi:hypothetical protein